MEPLKIAVIEDEPLILKTVCQFIEDSGNPRYRICGTAYNGREGLKLIEEKKPEIIISDIMMPVMGGIEMLEHLKNENYSARFILLSGHSEFRFARKALTLGVSEYLLKPVDKNELNQLLESLSAAIQNEKNQDLIFTLRDGISSINLEKKEDPLRKKFTYLILAYGSHPLKQKGTDENDSLARGVSFRNIDVREISNRYNLKIQGFPGTHREEWIFTVISGHQNFDIKKITSEIYRTMITKQPEINLVASERIGSYRDLRSAYRTARNHFLFAYRLDRNGIYYLRENYSPEKEYKVGKLIDDTARDFCIFNSGDQIVRRIAELISYWEKNMIPVQSIKKDLEYMLTYINRNQNIDMEDKVLPDLSHLFSGTGNYPELHAKVTDFFLKYLTPKENSNRDFQAKELVGQIKSFIEEHYRSQISTDQLEELFGYNKKHLSRVFKEETGLSPGQYHTKMRIDKAKKLLEENPEILIHDLALMMGYDDAYYFSRVFKNVTGKSPSGYLKEQQ